MAIRQQREALALEKVSARFCSRAVAERDDSAVGGSHGSKRR
ncbi:hypothetical protein OH687_39590 (plasmid) [Burkholderia anthina]|nr:hypothetical protein OH687_39590 [Burkholderia anthina]